MVLCKKRKRNWKLMIETECNCYIFIQKLSTLIIKVDTVARVFGVTAMILIFVIVRTTDKLIAYRNYYLIQSIHLYYRSL